MHLRKKLNRPFIYLFGFLFCLHLTPALYINSNFIEQFVGPKNVGYVYSVASILTILSFFWVRKILKRKGNFKTILTILTIETGSLLVMAIATSPLIAIFAYIINFVSIAMIFFNLDIFLEASSENNNTGGTRGYYMTFLNLAYIVGPLISSLLLTDHDFWKVYIFGVIIQIPVFYILIRYFKNFEDPIYQKPKLLKTFLKIKEVPDLYSTFASGFMLRIFYVCMIVYTPLFLVNEIGFSLSQTTMIMAIALIPFSILELVLGKISDKYLGEKELLTTGFVIISLSTMSLTFITSQDLFVWAGVLFITRIGAAMIEIMSEVHLFKRIEADNINILGLFRSISPIAYIISPVIASFFLLFVDFKYIFLILGVIMLYGLRYSLSIKDTK